MAGTLFAWWEVARIERGLRADVVRATRSVAQGLDLERIKSLTGTEADAINPSYQRIREQFSAILMATPGCRSIQLLGHAADGTIIVLAGSGPEAPGSLPPASAFPGETTQVRRAFATQTDQTAGPIEGPSGVPTVVGMEAVSDARAAFLNLATLDDAKAMVHAAVDYQAAHGKEALIRELDSPGGQFHRHDLFAFAFDTSMRMVAIPVTQEEIGKDFLNVKDWEGGWYFRREIQRLALSRGGGVVEYEYNNPVTKQREPKTTYFEKAGDLILCSGAYKGAGPATAVLAMGFDARAWTWILFRAAAPPILATLALAALFLTGSLLLERRAQRMPAPPAWMWHLESALAVAVGVVLTLTLAGILNGRDIDARNRAFDQLAISRVDAVTKTLRTLCNTELESLATFAESGGREDVSRFDKFATFLVKDPAVVEWIWAPAVPGPDRAAFEAAAKSEGHPDFQIWEHDSQGRRTAAAARPIHYPLYCLAPSANAGSLVGFDLGSDPVRRDAVERAAQSGLTTCTDLIRFVVAQGDPRGMLVCRPVFDPGPPHRLKGLAVASIRPSVILSSGGPDDTVLMAWCLVRPDGSREVLASSTGAPMPQLNDLSQVREVSIFGRVFEVSARAGPGFLKTWPLVAAQQVLLIGLASSAALPFAVTTFFRRRRELERLVVLRTQELRASEQSYRSQFAMNTAVMLVIDPSDGRILDANEAASTFYGHTRERLLAMRITDINTLPARKVLASMAAVGAAGKRSGRFDFTHRLADGSLRDVEVSSSRIQFGGRPVLHSIIFDITERKQAEAALNESEAKLRAVLDNSNEAIGVHCDGVWELCNAASLRLFGFGSPEEFVGSSIMESVAPSERERVAEIAQRRRSGGSPPLTYLSRGIRRDGTEFDMEVNSSSYWRAGKHHVLVILRDITAQRRAEAALRESEERYRLLVAASPDAVYLHRQGVIIFANKAGLELLRASRPEDLIGTPMMDRVHPDFREAVTKRVSKSMSENSILPTLYEKLVRLDGSTVDVEISGGSLTLEGQKTMMVLVRDVTERKRFEEDRDEALSRLRKIASNVPGMVYQYRMYPDGRSCFPFASDAIRDIYRVSPEEVREDAGKVFASLHPDDYEGIVESILESAGELTPWHFEYRVKFSDGVVRWLLGNAVPQREPDGSTLWHGFITDVTQRKRIEEALKESEARFRGLIDGSPDAVTVHRDGVIVYANPAAVRMFGAQSERDLVGKLQIDLVHPDDRPIVMQRRKLLVETGNPGDAVEMRFLRLDGTTFPVDSQSAGIIFDGEKAVQVVSRDISDRRRIEAERMVLERKLQETQKLESLGVLAGGIAHDFNNILTGILGNASLALLDLPVGSPARQNIQTIQQGSLRAADLCRQMLAYSGKGQFVIENIHLNTLVEETMQLLKVSVSKRAVLQFNLAAELPAILADATQLRQVVMNLVINASEAIGEKEGVITIRTKTVLATQEVLAGMHYAADMAGSRCVCLEVSDTGCGMDEDTQERIFDPFFTTKFMGRGLGLAAVMGIVRGHKGALGIRSKLGEGTMFKLLFPCAPASEAPAPAPAAEAPVKAWRGQGTALVVDDEAPVRTTLNMILKRLGFEVELAHDGSQAVEKFRERPGRYTLVLMDLTMPGLSGEEALVQMRRVRPDIRVVLMSGFSEQEAVSRFATGGLAGFIQKPFDYGTLKAAVQKAVPN